MQSMIPHYKCFQRMFSYQCWRVQYTLHRQVWNMQQPIPEFWTDQTARPQTIKYVQSRRSNFRQDSIQWMTHSQHWYHLRTTLCTWEICPATVFILQPRICVWANPSCTVMRAMLSWVVSNKMDQLQANISRECCFLCDRAAFTCLALIPGAGNNFKLLSIYFDLYVVFHELGLLGTAVGCRGFVQTLN